MKLDNFEKSHINGVEYYSIGSLISRTKERGKYHSDIKQVYAVSNVMGIIKAEDFRENAIQSDDTSNYTVIEPGMFAYNPSRLNIGSIAMLKSETAGLVSPMYVVFSVDENIITKEYFGYILETFYVKNKINSLKEEGARYRFDFDRWDLISIPIPQLKIQNEIVRRLDSFKSLMVDLAEELEARKKQYEYYRDYLLSFDKTIPIVKLGDIATDIYRGSGIKRDEVTDNGVPCVRYGEIYTAYNISFKNCISHTKESVVKNPKWFEHGDILFTITGESVDEISKSIAYLGDKKCLAGGDTVVLKHKQEPRYISYALSTAKAQEQKSKGKVKSKVVHSSVPALKEIAIPLPNYATQTRIADLLDCFHSLIFDNSSGLSAEINARKKQYEYYRDNLLDYKNLVKGANL